MNKKEYEKELMEKIVHSIEIYDKNKLLSSVIITGSFGRHEPTYSFNKDGELVLKSDIEIALIYKGNIKKRVNMLIENIAKDYTEDLNLMAISENRIKKIYNFNYSILIPKFKTLFTYDLYNGSYTLLGYDFLKKNNVLLQEVDLYEAKRLIANRIGELIYLQNQPFIENKNYLRKQWKGKLAIALGSAWLLCEEKYVSAYKQQNKIINANSADIKKVFGDGFIDDYNKIFKFLRESGAEYEISDNILKEYVYKFEEYYKQFNVDCSKVNNCARKLKYLIKYVKATKKIDVYKIEDKILQSLIDKYINGDTDLNSIAEIWHKVIY